MSLLSGFNISLAELSLMGEASHAAFAGVAVPSGWNVVTPAQLGVPSQYWDGNYFTNSGASAIVLQQNNTYIVSFRGTDGSNDVNQYPELFSGTYINNFQPLLSAVAANTPGDASFYFTGASLGGGATNLMANIASSQYGGHFAPAKFVAFASPNISNANGILNVGLENDPVYKAINNYGDFPSSLDNLVFASSQYMAGNYDGRHPFDTYAHSIGATAIAAFAEFTQSIFFNLMSPDSVVIFDANAGLVQDITPGRENTGVFYVGEVAADQISGRNGNDYIEGFGGADVLAGGAGNDSISGGAGADTLTGGPGSDTFFMDAAALADAQAGVFDRITDYAFAEDDRIDLSALLAGAYAHGNGQAIAALVRAVADPSGTFATLQVDVDGSGSAGWMTIARLDGVNAGHSIKVVLDGADAAVTIAAGAANSAPVISSNGGGDTASISVPEHTVAVTTVTASDADAGTTLAYAIIGGADASKFQINATSGALTFITAPSFGNPADSDLNNSYIVQVQASDGSLIDTQTITVSVTDVKAVASDFDGDGKSDILWRNDNGEAYIWEMNGLQSKATGSLGGVDTRWHIAGTGDFDGDGRSDILWRNDNGEAFIWEMNGLQAKAQGSLGVVDTRWHVASTGDFDGDGRSDILWRNDNGEAFIWEMNGLQAKAQGSLGIVDTRWHIASTGDFDGDGKSDILWRNDNGEAFIWEMNGLQAKAQASLGIVDTRWHIASTGDFDGDGKSDILWRNDNGEAFIWEMNGLQAKAQASLGGVDTRWHIQTTGDFDGDGKSDMAWRNDNGEAFIWEMNELQAKAQASLGIVDTRWHIASTGDVDQIIPLGNFDGDGKSDILWRNDNGEAYIWEMNGLQIKAQGSIATADTHWHIAGTGDFDSDGKSDILWRNDNGEAYIWEMNGLQIKAQGSIATAETFWHIAGTGDFDSDGKSDILWRNDNGEAYIWLMNGLQIKAQGSIATAETFWHIAGTGDFDSDGKSDILWRNDNGEAYIWEMNGLQIKAQGSIATAETFWHIENTGDFDSDGKSDILWRNDNGQAYIWEMNGLQIKAQGSIATAETFWHIAGTGDSDSDGKSDILWRNDNGEAYIWEMNGLQIKAQGSIATAETFWHIAGNHDLV